MGPVPSKHVLYSALNQTMVPLAPLLPESGFLQKPMKNRRRAVRVVNGAPLNRCPLCFGVSFFVPGLPDTKLKISRAESRIVTEPKVATPRRTARTVHPRAVQPREALRTALVWAKLTLSSPVYPETIFFEVDWRRTTTICSCPIFCGVCSRRSDFSPAKHGPAGHLRTALRRTSAWRPAQSK